MATKPYIRPPPIYDVAEASLRKSAHGLFNTDDFQVKLNGVVMGATWTGNFPVQNYTLRRYLTNGGYYNVTLLPQQFTVTLPGHLSQEEAHQAAVAMMDLMNTRRTE